MQSTSTLFHLAHLWGINDNGSIVLIYRYFSIRLTYQTESRNDIPQIFCYLFVKTGLRLFYSPGGVGNSLRHTSVGGGGICLTFSPRTLKQEFNKSKYLVIQVAKDAEMHYLNHIINLDG